MGDIVPWSFIFVGFIMVGFCLIVFHFVTIPSSRGQTQ